MTTHDVRITDLEIKVAVLEQRVDSLLTALEAQTKLHDLLQKQFRGHVEHVNEQFTAANHNFDLISESRFVR